MRLGLGLIEMLGEAVWFKCGVAKLVKLFYETFFHLPIILETKQFKIYITKNGLVIKKLKNSSRHICLEYWVLVDELNIKLLNKCCRIPHIYYGYFMLKKFWQILLFLNLKCWINGNLAKILPYKPKSH